MKDSLKIEEKVSAQLRGLYMTYGYLPYKVNKFEKYELYLRNKNFLSSEQILAFTDMSGELMALKPDITLSIVKNTKDEDAPIKVCYSENAYRVPQGAYGFKEIMQTGLECIGQVDVYTMGEVLMLASRSLAAISENYALDISDMGVVSGILDGESLSNGQRAEILALIGQKNAHGLAALLDTLGVSGEGKRLLLALVSLCGPLAQTLPKLEALGLPEACAGALSDMRGVAQMMEIYGAEHINLDFSVVNDMGYYNGLSFVGFIDGIPTSVLSGGRYDRMMQRMGRKSEAIGFAVYLDQLERFSERPSGADVDVLILYEEDAQAAQAAKKAMELTASGLSVRVQRGSRSRISSHLTVNIGEGEA